ncbi:MAG TPA: hypothetical protein VK489_06415 [Ferruginibacter sp.]|nr:hypothetical protein [Ferruginibacter sp.]
MKKFIILSCMLFITGNCFCQCDCNAVLVQDYLEFNWDRTTALHYINSLEENELNEKSVSFFGSAKFPYEGIPVEAVQDFKYFKQYKKNLTAHTDFKYSQAESLNYLSKKFSRDVLKAYNTCLELCNKKEGLSLFLSSADNKSVVVKLKYDAIGISRDKITIANIKSENLTVSPDDIKLKKSLLIQGTDKSFILNRIDPNQTSRFTIEFKYNNTTVTKSVDIAAFPQKPKYRIVRLYEKESLESKGLKTPTYDLNVYVLSGAYAGYDNNSPAGGSIDNYRLNDPVKHKVNFGKWADPTACKTSGEGWYIESIGSCGTGIPGSGIKGLQWVEIIVIDK